MIKPQITGKVSFKFYKCMRCGNRSQQSTNHYGKIYNMRCTGCSWKHGTQPLVVMECDEQLPVGWVKPEEWGLLK